MHSISKNLKQIRKEKGWTQQQMADHLFVTRQTVSNWENNKSFPDLATIEQISQKLDIDSQYLLYGRLTDIKYRKLRGISITIMLVVLIVLFVILEKFSLLGLERISAYAGYDILRPTFIGNISYSTFIVIAGIWTSPVWIAVLLFNWAMADINTLGYKTVKLFTNSVLSFILALAVYSSLYSCIYTFDRYKNVVITAHQRFEMEENLYGLQTYMYYDFGWRGGDVNQIAYIDNDDEKTDEFIDNVISSQALKIYRIDAESENANNLMWRHSIDDVPAVLIVTSGNVELLEGYEEISAKLESKIHNYKIHNIFFY